MIITMTDEELRQLRVAADVVALKSLFSWQCQVIRGLLLSSSEDTPKSSLVEKTALDNY